MPDTDVPLTLEVEVAAGARRGGVDNNTATYTVTFN